MEQRIQHTEKITVVTYKSITVLSTQTQRHNIENSENLLHAQRTQSLKKNKRKQRERKGKTIEAREREAEKEKERERMAEEREE